MRDDALALIEALYSGKRSAPEPPWSGRRSYGPRDSCGPRKGRRGPRKGRRGQTTVPLAKRIARAKAQANWETAKAEGQRTFTGLPCVWGHPGERYVYNRRRCLACMRPRKAKARRERRANELQRTPRWADLTAIAAVYWVCDQLQKEQGTPLAVDHVIPLQGKRVSGLHVAYNLQIITRPANSRKGHKFSDESPALLDRAHRAARNSIIGLRLATEAWRKPMAWETPAYEVIPLALAA